VYIEQPVFSRSVLFILMCLFYYAIVRVVRSFLLTILTQSFYFESEFKVSLRWANVAISRSAVFVMEKLHSFTCPWYNGKYQGTYVGNAMKKNLPNIIYLRVVRRKRTPRCTLLGKITNSEDTMRLCLIIRTMVMVGY
jgi:hypothetical protein